MGVSIRTTDRSTAHPRAVPLCRRRMRRFVRFVTPNPLHLGPSTVFTALRSVAFSYTFRDFFAKSLISLGGMPFA